MPSEPADITPAEDVVAPRNLFTVGDSPYSVLIAAFRTALLDGSEPHARHTKFDEGVDLDALVPDDAEVARSAADDDDTMLYARGPGYSLLLSTIGGAAVWITAATRDAADAIAADLRTRARTLGDARRSPGQYL
jgi:hypothetical protein